MSFLLCRKCGGANGIHGMTFFNCGCEHPDLGISWQNVATEIKPRTPEQKEEDMRWLDGMLRIFWKTTLKKVEEKKDTVLDEKYDEK